ncbi:MAG: HPr(Ser) kinase/phosphatase [Acidobacteria bacterium]|nr:HPr(Ser) kinase/phosphatase [Acidobacteriota bacterium]
MPDKEESMPDHGSLRVREFVTDTSLGLDLEILQSKGLDNEIRSPRIQKLGMALAGFTTYIHPDRIQIVGSSELNYLKELTPDGRTSAIQRLKRFRICCIVVTKGLDPPKELAEFCARQEIPILRTRALSSLSTSKMTRWLENRLAPRATVHGVLVEVFGLGVLIIGPSGIGKSECALELILRGHRLVTDDSVEITRRGLDRLLGTGGKILRHHMELRGLGIINIKDIFGISATAVFQPVDFAVRLERWNSEVEYDRLGIDQSTMELLGVPIPLIVMPVAPGRNLAALVEVAARIHMLRQRGYNPAKELEELT